MKLLHLLRHAKSSWKDSSLTDADRPLAARGRRAAEVIAMLRKERETLQAKIGAGDADRAELQRLRQERKEMLGQVNTMLKEMEKLDL